MTEQLTPPSTTRPSNRRHPLAVAFLGLGAMGMPMSRRLADAHDVVVFDVDEDRRDTLVSAGARSAESPAGAAYGADVLVLAVRNQDHVEAALFGPEGAAAVLRPGSVVLLTSTVGPDFARQTAERLAQIGVGMLDAPVSGGPARAELGDLLITVGGQSDVVDRCRPVLDRLASTVAHIGPRPGDGQAMKVVNQLLCGVHIAAAAEALALARGLGLDTAAALDVLGRGAAASFMLADRGPRMLDPDPSGPVRSRLDLFVKDMGIVTNIAGDVGVSTPVAAAAEQLFLLGQRAGLSARDDSSIVTLLSPTRSNSDDQS
jgi:3-hydroxyisobutyrate dehydrogenase